MGLGVQNGRFVFQTRQNTIQIMCNLITSWKVNQQTRGLPLQNCTLLGYTSITVNSGRVLS